MNNIPQEHYAKILISAGIGVWKVDLEDRYLYFYNYEIVGLKFDRISIDDWYQTVRDDSREVAHDEVRIFCEIGTYEMTYPVVISGEEFWLHSKSFLRESDENGHDVVWGIFHRVVDPKEIDVARVKNDMINIIHKQNNIAKNFVSFLGKTNIESNINLILKEVVDYFNASRCVVFEFDNIRGTRSCVYEVTANGADSVKHLYQNEPMDTDTWMNRKLILGAPILVDDVAGMADAAGVEKAMFLKTGVKSIMVVSLPSKNGILGYVAVEINDRIHKWSNLDYQWISAVANMMGVCIELYKSEGLTNIALSTQASKDRMLMQVFNNSPVGVEIYDDNGTLIMLNRATASIYGLTGDIDDVIGINLFESSNISEDVKDQIRRHEDVHFRINYDASTCKEYWETNLTEPRDIIMRVTNSFDENGVFLYYMVISVDNTELSSIASKMEDFENIFSVISEYAKVGYSKWDVLKQDGFATKQWFNNFGEDEDSNMRDVALACVHVHPDDRARLMSFVKNVKRKESTQYIDDLRVDNGNGGWKWVHVYITTDERNGRLELLSVTMDSTAMKESEMALIEAKNKAETMDRLKSAFLANMSHEIRTPLNAIIGFAGLITAPDFDSADAAEREYYGTIIKDNSDLLLQLISDILDISKIEAGTLDFSYDSVDINEMCTNLYNIHKDKVHDGVVMRMVLPQDKCIMRSDKNRLMQVLINFLTNAVKFTQEGSIFLGYKIVKEEIEFFVQDTGIGISEVNTKLVFDSFVKLNNSIKGTGLGLAISKSIISQMGGTIGVSSKIGEGSRFWFRLPYIKAEMNVPSEELTFTSSTDTQGTEKNTVLIAEDDENSYILISTILKKKYKLLWAKDGDSAVEMWRQKHPDIILMDLRMQNMDGLSATREIRKDDKKTPIVCITAYAFNSDHEAATKAGCNAFLTKPISGTLLKETISYLLSLRTTG